MSRIPFRVSPMLATLVAEPFSRKNWVFEEKYDGVRMLAYKETSHVSLISRNAIDRSDRYPAIVAELGKLDVDTLLLDGEVMVFGRNKVSQFQLLQQGKGEPVHAVFDCLYRKGRDLRHESLARRRSELEHVLHPGRTVQIARRLSEDGMAAVGPECCVESVGVVGVITDQVLRGVWNNHL